jgi:hypothetical protein
MIDYTYAKGTKVPVGRSRDEIEGVLTRIGADAIGFMKDSTAAQIAFRIAGRHYVLKLPVNPDDAQGERERWRQLLLLAKAKMAAIAAGISTPEAEFMAHAMLPSGQTLGEHLAEHPEQLTTSGRLMLPGGD